MNAAAVPDGEVATLAMLLLAVAAVVGVAQLGGLVATRCRQPAVIGEMLAVIITGPGVLGAVAPDITVTLFSPAVLDVIRPLGGIGVVLFVSAVGIEIPRDLLRSVGRKTMLLGTSAFVLPAAAGVGLGLALDAFAPRFGMDDPTEILFLGLAMGMTAFPVLARILQDVGGLQPEIRTLGLSIAGCADAFGWGGLVLLLAGDLSTGVFRLLGAVSGVMAVVFLGRLTLQLISRWARHQVLAACAEGGVVLAVLFASAAISEFGELHSVVGALAAGLSLPRTERVLALAGTLNTIACVVLLPMFYVGVSASIRLNGLANPKVLVLLITVIAIAIRTKVLACWLPARSLAYRTSTAFDSG